MRASALSFARPPSRPGLASSSALICPARCIKQCYSPRRFHHHLLNLFPSRCARHRRSGSCAARPAPPCLSFPLTTTNPANAAPPLPPSCALGRSPFAGPRSRSRVPPDPPALQIRRPERWPHLRIGPARLDAACPSRSLRVRPRWSRARNRSPRLCALTKAPHRIWDQVRITTVLTDILATASLLRVLSCGDSIRGRVVYTFVVFVRPNDIRLPLALAQATHRVIDY
jgi:hypothetical protein